MNVDLPKFKWNCPEQKEDRNWSCRRPIQNSCPKETIFEEHEEDLDENDESPNVKKRRLDTPRLYKESIGDALGTFKNFQIASSKAMHQVFSSFFVQTGTKLIKLDTHSLEIYSAKLLAERVHWRTQKQYTTGVVLNIPATVNEFIDDDLSVIRPNSGIYHRHEKNFYADIEAMLFLFNTIGNGSGGKYPEEKRRISDSFRSMCFGVKPEIPQEYGKENLKIAESVNELWTNIARKTIGCVLDFMWNVGNSIQDKLQRPALGGCLKRRKTSGRVLQKMFSCHKSEFEHLDILLWILDKEEGGSMHPFCLPHKDQLNDRSETYCKTLCMNLSYEDPNGVVFMFQFIANFRRHPQTDFDRKKKLIVDNIRHYEWYRWKNYCMAFPISPTTMNEFYLDDELGFIEKFICEGCTKQKHKMSLFFLPIGTSRTLSLSGFIAPMYDNRLSFTYNNLLGLCFFGSFFNTPVLFNYGIRKLVSVTFHLDSDSDFDSDSDSSSKSDLDSKNRQLSMIGLCKLLQQEFGSWQRGINPRYSPANDTVVSIQNLDVQKQRETMDQVTKRLHEWINHIDKYHGKEDASDIPAHLIRRAMNEVVVDIQGIYFEATGVSLDFSIFRLSIFTNLVTGLGFLKPGRHLNQLFLPSTGTASYGHLVNPTLNEHDATSNKNLFCVPRGGGADIEVMELDNMMRQISNEMGWKSYQRNFVEVNLCESVSGRYLSKKDIFFKGQTIHHLTEDGVPLVREYGQYSVWREVEAAPLPPRKILTTKDDDSVTDHGENTTDIESE